MNKKGAHRVLVTKIFAQVNYDLGIHDAVEAMLGPTPTEYAEYRRHQKDPDITDLNFPSTRRGIAEIEISLCFPGCRVRFGAVIRFFHGQGLRALELPELLALGRVCLEPKLDSWPIAGLGSVWLSPDDRLYTPSIYDDSGLKRVHLDWAESVWASRYIFAAVPGHDHRLDTRLSDAVSTLFTPVVPTAPRKRLRPFARIFNLYLIITVL